MISCDFKVGDLRCPYQNLRFLAIWGLRFEIAAIAIAIAICDFRLTKVARGAIGAIGLFEFIFDFVLFCFEFIVGLGRHLLLHCDFGPE